ncbi:MAG: alpha/beta hydrolase [Myxococcales bacterium]|nr:alpha/beta hydrolase [Myxococcales bacterium]
MQVPTTVRFTLATALLLTASNLGPGCAPDGNPTDAATADAATADASSTPRESCDVECAPNESVVGTGAECRCSTEGTHMRLGGDAEDFYAHPWPLDGRLAADGTLDLEAFPLASTASFLVNNLDLIAQSTHGFSTHGALFMSFDGPIDPTSLPETAAATLETSSPIALLNVDPDSEEQGQRSPIRCQLRAEPSAYNPPHFLSCLPVPGFPLRPSTRYALVLTDQVLDAEGAPLRATQPMARALAGTLPAPAELAEAYQPLADYLAGSAPTDATVVAATVFTTQDPATEMAALAAHVQGQEPPALQEIELDATSADAPDGYHVITGSYVSPDYQQGQTPYSTEGGYIRFDASGEPVQSGELRLRFALSLPAAAMPAEGWPVVLYLHGSGGDAQSFIRNGTATRLAAEGLAAIGIDAPVHGLRNPGGGDPSLLFFNINNPMALRDNVRQGAADLLALERFVAALSLDAAQSPLAEPLAFDTGRIYVMGHSQGALTAPLMLVFAEHTSGAMLSGAGAGITQSILHKTAPVNIPVLARVALGIALTEPLDAHHPALALIQAFSDVADSINFVPYLYRWQGGRGVDLWVTQGLLDDQSPPQVTDALIVAAGLGSMAPLSRPVFGADLAGLQSLSSPIAANREAVAGGRYTAVHTQYPDDGHFLVFENPQAEAQLRHYFKTLVRDGRGELISP